MADIRSHGDLSDDFAIAATLSIMYRWGSDIQDISRLRNATDERRVPKVMNLLLLYYIQAA